MLTSRSRSNRNVNKFINCVGLDTEKLFCSGVTLFLTNSNVRWRTSGQMWESLRLCDLLFILAHVERSWRYRNNLLKQHTLHRLSHRRSKLCRLMKWPCPSSRQTISRSCLSGKECHLQTCQADKRASRANRSKAHKQQQEREGLALHSLRRTSTASRGRHTEHFLQHVAVPRTLYALIFTLLSCSFFFFLQIERTNPFFVPASRALVKPRTQRKLSSI